MHKICYCCSYVNTVVDIGFENVSYTVNEDIGTADFCMILTGRIERELSLNVATIPVVSLGNKSNQCLQISG